MWYLDRLNHSNMNDLRIKIDPNRPKLVQQNNTKNWLCLFVCAFEQFCTFLPHFFQWRNEDGKVRSCPAMCIACEDSRCWLQQLWPVQECYWFWTRNKNSTKTTLFVKVALGSSFRQQRLSLQSVLLSGKLCMFQAIFKKVSRISWSFILVEEKTANIDGKKM